jgi:7,8-dihydroneopterin aldolase/epimerase/oxygenase
MGLIEVNGIRVRAYHGCLEEEAMIGGDYIVDVHVAGDLEDAERRDDLSSTVDYGRVTAIVLEQMGQRSRLIEHVAARILAGMKAEWRQDLRWRVRVVKLRPPINGDVDQAAYTLEG